MRLSDQKAYWEEQAAQRTIQLDGKWFSYGYLEKYRQLAHILNAYIDPSVKILEIGCGGGLTALRVCNSFRTMLNYTAIDLSEQFAGFAHHALGFDSACARSDALPFKDGSFDVIWMFDVFEHIPPELREETRAEIERVVSAKGGAICLNNPMHTSKHDQRYEWLVDDIDLLRIFPKWRIHQKITYEVEGTPSEFIMLAERGKC